MNVRFSDWPLWLRSRLVLLPWSSSTCDNYATIGRNRMTGACQSPIDGVVFLVRTRNGNTLQNQSVVDGVGAAYRLA